MDKREFDYKVGNRYLVFGTWDMEKAADNLECQHSTVVCTYVFGSGDARLTYEAADCNEDRAKSWVYRPDGMAFMHGFKVKKAPLSIVLKELPPKQRTITIEGKTIPISEESYQALRKELL